MIRIIIIFILTALMILNSLAASEAKVLQAFYCNNHKLELEDTTYTIFKNCGEPAFREVVSAKDCAKVEKWHYDCEGRGYIEELTFTEGLLTDRSKGERSQGVQKCNTINKTSNKSLDE